VKKKAPQWIEDRDVLAIHDRLLALHGGASGMRDQGLLQSALARPRQHHAYASPTDVITKAALCTSGVVRNHPFTDGNKRTGFVTGILFLELNGFKFTAAEEGATQAVLELAAGTIEEDVYTSWLRANSKPKRQQR
jgi:death-on-curing protein